MNEAALVRDAPASQADASLAEITAKRRGLLRRYLYQHPRVMDGVVVFSYALLVAPTAVDSIMSGPGWRRRSSAWSPGPVLPALPPRGAGGPWRIHSSTKPAAIPAPFTS
ncbi:hypothetical protein AHiyo4_00070 [Arthrobacter sp. Hiyo4]|nr:hypothetical protein AHiyo4_00070 [Arthrobacter sp. Hiyo4]